MTFPPLSTTKHIADFLAEHRKKLSEGAMMPKTYRPQPTLKRASKKRK